MKLLSFELGIFGEIFASIHQISRFGTQTSNNRIFIQSERWKSFLLLLDSTVLNIPRMCSQLYQTGSYHRLLDIYVRTNICQTSRFFSSNHIFYVEQYYRSFVNHSFIHNMAMLYNIILFKVSKNLLPN